MSAGCHAARAAELPASSSSPPQAGAAAPRQLSQLDRGVKVGRCSGAADANVYGAQHRLSIRTRHWVNLRRAQGTSARGCGAGACTSTRAVFGACNPRCALRLIEFNHGMPRARAGPLAACQSATQSQSAACRSMPSGVNLNAGGVVRACYPGATASTPSHAGISIS